MLETRQGAVYAERRKKRSKLESVDEVCNTACSYQKSYSHHHHHPCLRARCHRGLQSCCLQQEVHRLFLREDIRAKSMPQGGTSHAGNTHTYRKKWLLFDDVLRWNCKRHKIECLLRLQAALTSFYCFQPAKS